MTVVIPGFFALFAMAMLIINLILTVLLFIKGEIEGRGDTTRLGAAYLYVTLIIITQLASFPGGFTAAPLIGSPQSPIWQWFFWHVGFGVLIIRYAWCARQPSPPPSSWLQSIIVIPALALAVTWISCAYAEQLPSVFADGHFVFGGNALLMLGPVVVITLAALLSVASLRATTPERLWLMVGLVASCLEVWLNCQGSARFTLGWYLAKVGSLGVSLAVLISLLREITLLYAEAESSNAILQKLVRLDALTGLFNRRGFDERLDEEFRRACRLELPLSLVLVDVDFFKAYNDHYGHQAGDDCLRRIGAAIKGALCRPGDHAARYGGEEIVILLPATDNVGAMLIAERALNAVAALGIPHLASPLGTVSISAGVGSMLPTKASNTRAQDLVEAADRALYQAKKAGRNQACAGTADLVAAPAVADLTLESQLM
jgi:diguanylate cyclase (GGDEF)-like protein